MDAYTKAKLDYLADTKEAIKAALIASGQEVSDADTFRSYADKIRGIGSSGVDPYYQKLAVAMIMRDLSYMDGDEDVLEVESLQTTDGQSIGTIEPYAFAGFDDIIGATVADAFFIKENAFRDCTSMRFLDLTLRNDSTLNAAGCMTGSLTGCNALEAVIFRDGGAGVSNAIVYADNGANEAFFAYVPSEYYDAIVANLADTNIPAERYRKLEEYPEIECWTQKFTVEFYDGDVHVGTKTVRYGQSASLSYSKEGYTFIGWSPEPENVTSDLKCYAQWKVEFADATWEMVVEKALDGTAASLWSKGEAKDLTLTYEDGTTETVQCKIGGFNDGVMEDGNPCNIYFTTTQPLATNQKLSDTAFTRAELSNAEYMELYLIQYLQETVYNALPDALREAVKTKWFESTGTKAMKMWLPMSAEIDSWSMSNDYYTKIPHFYNAADRILYKRDATSPVSWWLDGTTKPTTMSKYYAQAIGINGKEATVAVNGAAYTGTSETTARGVIFGFCI